MRFSLGLMMFLWAGAATALCPDPNLGGPRYAATGPDLIAPQRWTVRARGSEAAPCAGWEGQGIASGEMTGFLPVAPTAVFELESMAPHILMVMAEAACRPVLAARTPDGLWFFGETANGRQELVIWGAPDGPLQVWVGAATEEGCDGSLILETFDR